MSAIDAIDDIDVIKAIDAIGAIDAKDAIDVNAIDVCMWTEPLVYRVVRVSARHVV